MSQSPRISPISSRRSSSAVNNSHPLSVPVAVPVPLVVSDPQGRSTRTDTMSITTPQKTILPFNLLPYHLLFLSFVSSIVILGTLYSILTGSYLYNVQQTSISSTFSTFSSYQHSTHSYSYNNPIKPTFYFSSKKNFFNVYFVKLAWFWTSLATLIQIILLRSASTNPALNRSLAKGKAKQQEDEDVEIELMNGGNRQNVTSPVAISVLRWLVATACWGELDVGSRCQNDEGWLLMTMLSYSR